MILASLAILVGLAVLSPVLCGRLRRAGTLLVAAGPAAAIGLLWPHIPGVLAGEPIVETVSWVPALGVDLAFRIDGLALLFVLLICGIAAMVLLYASSYLGEHPRLPQFTATLISFTAAMLGLVTADNLILLFIFWELTSITSFLLIGFDAHREAARKSAERALLVTGLGGLALLAGVILAGLAADSFSATAVLATPLHQHPHYEAIAVLLLLAAFTKSAIFPFHFWLPGAMEAPSPVSALLHSATMVKAGVYLVARFQPAMSGTLIWDETLALFGGLTMVFAAVMAVRNTQFKKILAYSTVSSLGTLIMLLGLGATKAAVTYLIAHAFFKGCLFMVAGSITKRTGEKDVEKLSGLRSAMPVTALIALLAALSMAGMFPLIGFVGKELVLKAGLSHPEWAIIATIATATAGTLTVLAALLVGIKPLLGAQAGPTEHPKPASWRQLAGPVVLALAGIATGLAPYATLEAIILSAMASIDGVLPDEKLKLAPLDLLWPPTAATWLSVAALTVGSVLFAVRGGVRAVLSPLNTADRVGPQWLWETTKGGVLGFAALQTRFLQSGSLQNYIRLTLITILGVVGAAAFRAGLPDTRGVSIENVSLLDWIIGAGTIVTALSVAFQKTALGSVAVTGGVGFLLALYFGVHGAPDVAATQFAVETLVVIIFVLVIFHLSRYRSLTNPRTKLIDGLVAIAFGGLMAALTFTVASRPAPESISAFHAERSVVDAFGRNIVNVILVDFRALDTLGEVFVVATAAMGVFTLLALRTKPVDATKQPADAATREDPA